MPPSKPKSIDAYMAGFPANIQVLLDQMRAAVQAAAPEALEAIKYGIPTFVLDENVVHFAAYKDHIGFYPTPSGIAAFKKALSKYKGAKGSVQFPLSDPLPLNLVREIVEFRVAEIRAKRANR